MPILFFLIKNPKFAIVLIMTLFFNRFFSITIKNNSFRIERKNDLNFSKRHTASHESLPRRDFAQVPSDPVVIN